MRSLLQMFLALLTLAAMAWAVWQGILLLRQEQLGLSPGSRSIVIIAAILIIICTFMVTQAIDTHGRNVYAGQQFGAKYALYDRCIGVFQVLLQELPAGQEMKMDLQFRELDTQLVLLASSKVLRAFNELREVTGSRGLNTEAALAARHKLLLAMREDLGVQVDTLVKKYSLQLIK